MNVLGEFLFKPMVLLFEKYYYWKLIQLMNKVYKCKHHDEFFELLGKPSYVQDGKNYSDLTINEKKVKVDYVEVYKKKYFTLYLQYADGVMAEILGTVNHSAWWNNLITKESHMCIVNEHFTEDQQMLNRPLNYETYLSFFSKHFIEKKTNDMAWEKRKMDCLLELYNIIKDTGRYKTINDIAEVLEESKNPYIEFSKSGRLCIGYDVLAARLALVDKDLREKLSDNFLHPGLLEKMGKINN